MLRYIDGRQRSLNVGSHRVERSGDRWLLDGKETVVAVPVGDDWLVSLRGQTHRVSRRMPPSARKSVSHSGELVASMPGVIVDVRVSVGDEVEEGATLVVLEAMKTQQPVKAPVSCRILSINVEKGKQVVEGAVLVTFSPLSS